MAGTDKRLPVEISAAMLRGASLLKAVRRWRGLPQTEVSARTGIGQGYLSDLESRRRAGPVETIEKLAKALDVPATWLDLVRPPQTTTGTPIK